MWEYGNRKLQKNGAWPQNTWVNGKEYWSGFQIDQVGYPIQLFYHVYQQSAQVSRTQLREKLSPMVARGMDFIMQHGPWSAQERWEENFGISPSSFSAATAALLMGHKLSPDSQRGQNAYRIARQWLDKPGDNIDTWTFTNKGILGDGQYYLRVAGCSTYEAVWNPNDSTSCHLANSSDRLNPSAFIDQGFLQLSLLGLRPANDWRLLKSLDVVNQQIRAQTAKGAGWFRYKHDAYGDGGKGRIWPLLAGEHGRFALERMRAGNLTEEAAMVQVQQIIDSFIAMANDGGMLPEQVFEDSGEGTGAATPLAWSHAEFIKLLWSRHYKRNVENIQFNQIK
jgi:glucoamylase